MAKKRKKPIKRYAVAVLLALALVWPVGAQAACFGFTDEQMPAAVAEYICQYEGVQRGIIGYDEDATGVWLYSQLSDADGVVLAYVLSYSKGPGDEYIYYFQLVDGTVLLDRRVPVELKGQEG